MFSAALIVPLLVPVSDVESCVKGLPLFSLVLSVPLSLPPSLTPVL
jgi:hypothetical protein